MTGLYSNNNKILLSFIFIEGDKYNKSCHTTRNKYSKVGKFKPLSFEGNFMSGAGCLVRWYDEN